jgi:hypothetical protein
MSQGSECTVGCCGRLVLAWFASHGGLMVLCGFAGRQNHGGVGALFQGVTIIFAPCRSAEASESVWFMVRAEALMVGTRVERLGKSPLCPHHHQ